jgi:hypothetical protein
MTRSARLERPAILTEAVAIQRAEHGYTEADLVGLAGLSRDRLADLLPEHFSVLTGRGPTLTVVR